MADAYHPYLAEELPLNIPTNKRRERSIEVASFAATRPATMAAANESLLASLEDDPSSSAFFDDIVGFSIGSSMGDLIDDNKNNNNENTNSNRRPEVYDDEYGATQTPRASMDTTDQSMTSSSSQNNNPTRSEEFIAEKFGSTDRGELSSNDSALWNKYDDLNSSIADTDLGLEEGSSGGNDDDDDDDDGQSSDDDIFIDTKKGGEDGLSNLETLQSQRRKYTWRASSGNSDFTDEYTSEMEFFVEDTDGMTEVDYDDDDLLGLVEKEDNSNHDDDDNAHNNNNNNNNNNSSSSSSNHHQKTTTTEPPVLSRLDSYSEEKGSLVRGDEVPSPKRRNSILSSHDPDDPLMPVDIASVKEMEKEDYWNLFHRILSMPTNFVPEDHMDPLEFFKRRDAVRRELRAQQIQEEKEQAKYQRLRARLRRSFEAASPARSRSTEVFEPPSNMMMKGGRPAPPVRARSIDREIFEPPSDVMKVQRPALIKARSVDTEIFEPPTNLRQPRQPNRPAVPPPRCRSHDSEIFEPPNNNNNNMTKNKQSSLLSSSNCPTRRRSSFSGITTKERQRTRGPTPPSPISLSRKLHSFRFVRPKKPVFVSKTQKAMASLSSKFHSPKRRRSSG